MEKGKDVQDFVGGGVEVLGEEVSEGVGAEHSSLISFCGY